MLQQFTLENFKAFKEKVSLDMKPLTLFYGANSGGKSTLLQSIIFQKQIFEPQHVLEENFIRYSGKYLDLGSFENVVHNHKEEYFILGQTINIKKGEKIRLEIKFEKNVKQDVIKEVDFYYNDESNKCISLSNLSDWTYTPHINLDSKIFDKYKDEVREKMEMINLLKLVEKILNQARSFMMPEESPEPAMITKSKMDMKKGIHESTNSKEREERDVDKLGVYAKPYVNIQEIIQNFDQSTSSDIDKFDRILKLLDDIDKFKDAELDIANIRMMKLYLEESRGLIELLKGNFSKINSRIEQEQIEYSISESKYIRKREESKETDIDKNFIQGNDVFSLFKLNIVETINKYWKEYINFLNRIEYIGPLREHPRRYYQDEGQSAKHVGKSGDNTWYVLLQKSEKNKNLIKEINELFLEFHIKYKVKLVEYTAQREDDEEQLVIKNIYSLVLIDENGIETSMNDVGFGISQIFPIILQCLVSEHSTIIIEQPEIHIHPALQSKLINLFNKSIKEKNNRLIIETHSEHLMYKIRSVLGNPSSNVELKNDEIASYFVDKDVDEKNMKVREIKLTENGRLLSNWPTGFFDDLYDSRNNYWNKKND